LKPIGDWLIVRQQRGNGGPKDGDGEFVVSKRLTGYLLTTICAVGPAAGYAGTLTTLYQFTGSTDGGLPSGNIAILNDQVFGTTQQYGSFQCGTIFEIELLSGAETTPYSFENSPDGCNPSTYAGLIPNGTTLYGTTLYGGANSSETGSVFQFNPATGTESIYPSFLGFMPYGTVSQNGGILYGTSERGGPSNAGSVFSINTETGAYSQLYTFAGALDAASPIAAPILENGRLYGTADAGGSYGFGAVFRLIAPTKLGQPWKETLLHSFSGGTDGGNAQGPLIYHGGLAYGTTAGTGDANGSGYLDGGTIFQINLASGAEKVLHNFQPDSGDGYAPLGALLYQGGSLYGTTQSGGKHQLGTIFRYNIATGAETVLFSFNGTNGAFPSGTLFYYNGSFYGTTAQGGTGYGTVFKFTP
jgi:uncharacterized repeat protein (TIGR03803 family)